MKKYISILLCILLVAAMAMTGCSKQPTEETTAAAQTEAVTEAPTEAETEPETEAAEAETEAAPAEESEEAETILLTDGETYGEGETEFTFVVKDLDGNEVSVTVKTDKATVGEALLELNMIAGDDSEWGLYVKTVNGVTADFNVDGHYWAFYIDGEYAMTGVDATDVTAGAVYTFAVE